MHCEETVMVCRPKLLFQLHIKIALKFHKSVLWSKYNWRQITIHINDKVVAESHQFSTQCNVYYSS